MEHPYEHLSDRIMSLKAAARIRTKQLFADTIGVSATLISYYKRKNVHGDTTASVLAQICEAFPWLSASWLLTGKGLAIRQNLATDGTSYIPMLDVGQKPDGLLVSHLAKSKRYLRDELGYSATIPFAFAFEITDNSMEQWGYPPGSVVLCDAIDTLKPNAMSLVLTPSQALIRLPILAHKGRDTQIGLVMADAPDIDYHPISDVAAFRILGHFLSNNAEIVETTIFT